MGERLKKNKALIKPSSEWVRQSVDWKVRTHIKNLVTIMGLKQLFQTEFHFHLYSIRLSRFHQHDETLDRGKAFQHGGSPYKVRSHVSTKRLQRIDVPQVKAVKGFLLACFHSLQGGCMQKCWRPIRRRAIRLTFATMHYKLVPLG